MATAGEQGIVVVDDFGEGLDGAAAQHLAATLRRSARQVWLSTRRTQVIEAFPLEELVRLGRDPVAARRVYYGRMPKSKTERLAVRHWASQLAPALTSRVAVVVEGPHDRAALTSLANRLHEEESVPLPAATRVALIDAATSDGSGGATAIPRLAKAAGELGLHTIAVLDYDRSEPDAKAALKACVEAASLVIRLPKGYAIELALLTGLDDDVVKTALAELRDAFGLTIKQDLEQLSGPALHKVGCEILKQSAGLHAQYVHALPANVYPPLARRLLETAIGAAVDLTKGIAQKELRQL
jgi:hypothetical protein